jgi:hypothetical protein
VKVFTPSYAVVPTGLKVGCILNLLWLDSKQKPVQMYNNQQPVLIERVQLLWECNNWVLQTTISILQNLPHQHVE